MDCQELIPEKSPNDTRDYCGMNLPNGLSVLLIHDPTVEKSACSVSVGVGSLEDVDRSLGLAHFLEHMLFMGSTKYPEHNSYSSFITNNSGFDNAYTSDSETNYYFEVKNSALCEAAERLSNFFTGALLNETCIEKESQAVHEEYVLWTNDDNCRKWEVLRKLAVGPYSRFSIGNNKTLRHPDIREDLVEFYNKFYSSNIIKGVICSYLPIEEMKAQLVPFLEEIPNKNVERPTYDLHFKEGCTGKLVKMQSIKDESIMQFFWVVENLRPLRKYHIEDYICHVIGHEGEESLLSTLKSLQYATEISSYTHHLISQTIVGLEIKLTEEGKENYEEIYNIVNDYVGSLTVEQHIFNEIKSRNQIKFKFQEKSEISHYVCKLSSKMHYTPLEEILNYSVLFEEYNPEIIEKILKQMSSQNLIIVYSNSEAIEGAEQEKYLGAKYRIDNLPESKNSGFKFLSLAKNEFVPVNTDIYVDETVNQVAPKKIADTIFFLPNGQFKVCKGGIQLRLHSEQSYAFKVFYAKYLQLLMKQLIYNAEVLETQIRIQANKYLCFRLFGFNDTLMKMLNCIGERFWQLHEGERSEKIYELALNDLIEEYQNFYCEDADRIANETLSLILNEGDPSIEQIKERLQQLEYEDIQNRVSKFWERGKAVWTVVGNFQEQKVQQTINHFGKKVRVGISHYSHKPSGCMKVPNDIQHQILLTSDELSTSCCIVYYEVGPYSEELYHRARLLRDHIDEPFFNALRTEKQLAYYLAVKVQNVRGVLGLQFLLVSSTKDAYEISVEIKNFVKEFFGNLDENLNEEKLTQLKNSVETKIIAPHNNLKDLNSFVNREISRKTFNFNRKTKEQARKYLDPITLEELKQLSQRILNQSLDIYTVCKGHQEAYQAHNLSTKSFEEIREKAEYHEDYLLE